jgi:signal transduction histidine kinase
MLDTTPIVEGASCRRRSTVAERRWGPWVGLLAAASAGACLLISTLKRASAFDVAAAAVLLLATVTGSILAAVLQRRVRRLESELGDALQRVEDERASKNILLGTVSHELKTPLQTVLASVDLIEESGVRLDESMPETTSRLRRAAEALHGRLGDVLSLAHAGSRPVTALDKVYSFSAVAFEAARDAGHALARDKGLALEMFPPQVNWAVKGDPGRLRQIVQNLVSNACLYTVDGRVQVHVGALVTDGQNGSALVRLDVVDTGVGIAARHLPLLFRPFTRLGASERASERRLKGGVGLAIVKALVEGAGGQVAVDSAPGRGSRFTVWLRVHAVAPWVLKPANETHIVLLMEKSSVRDGMERAAKDCGAHVEILPGPGTTVVPDIVIVDADDPHALGHATGFRRRSVREVWTPMMVGISENCDRCCAATLDVLISKPGEGAEATALIRDLIRGHDSLER